MLKLYYSPGACSLAAHIALRELKLPFTLECITLANGEHNLPEFIAINPRARLPVLIVEGQAMTELSGILSWIGYQKTGLMPAAGTLEAAKCGG